VTTNNCRDFGYEPDDRWAKLPLGWSWIEVVGVARQALRPRRPPAPPMHLGEESARKRSPFSFQVGSPKLLPGCTAALLPIQTDYPKDEKRDEAETLPNNLCPNAWAPTCALLRAGGSAG
jgi:hypothetical protein